MDEITVKNELTYPKLLISKDDYLFKCKVCKKAFAKSKSLKLHERIHKGKPAEVEVKEEPRDREKESSKTTIESKSKDFKIKTEEKNCTKEKEIINVIGTSMQTFSLSILNEEITQSAISNSQQLANNSHLTENGNEPTTSNINQTNKLKINSKTKRNK
jgi:hypothetical protein